MGNKGPAYWIGYFFGSILLICIVICLASLAIAGTTELLKFLFF